VRRNREGSGHVAHNPARMILGLLRHGVAHDAGPESEYRDELRELTDDGRKRIRAAAAGIATLHLEFAALATSPLIRCEQTAAIVGDALGLTPRADPRLRPGLHVQGLLDLLMEYPGAESILVCGHQPDLSTVTADLCFGGLVEFKKGALALIELPEPRERAGHLVALYPPATLRQLGR
jgi:phosphohistidine phosphatase